MYGSGKREADATTREKHAALPCLVFSYSQMRFSFSCSLLFSPSPTSFSVACVFLRLRVCMSLAPRLSRMCIFCFSSALLHHFSLFAVFAVHYFTPSLSPHPLIVSPPAFPLSLLALSLCICRRVLFVHVEAEPRRGVGDNACRRVRDARVCVRAFWDKLIAL